MSFIVEDFEKAVENSSTVVEDAKKMLLNFVIPDRISRAVVEKFFRKALRVGVWRYLKTEQRALILALRIWGREVRSRKLLEIVRGMFLEIELSTLKGKALLYGIAIAIKNGSEALKNLFKNIGYILATGIMYLNNPPMLRVYG
jgi:hypothetical protein